MALQVRYRQISILATAGGCENSRIYFKYKDICSNLREHNSNFSSIIVLQEKASQLLNLKFIHTCLQ